MTHGPAAWQRYFDNAATTPLDPRVLEAMLPFLRDGFGNANSIHQLGRAAGDAVEQARQSVAELIGAPDPSQIFFTSGATEGNNWVLKTQGSFAVSPFEHSSVREVALGRRAEILSNCGYDISPPEDAPALVSVMRVNNETGAVLMFPSVPSHTLRHIDATQAIGKIPFAVDACDFATLSAHKFYGPKGVGVLFAARPISPFIQGGEQELGLRGGTLNVPGIVGLGKAAELVAQEFQEDAERAARQRSAVLDELSAIAGIIVNEAETQAPHILSVSFRGLEGETLVVEMDAAGYAISSGAACSSHSTEPSSVLEALGLDPEVARGTIRISMGRFNSMATTQAMAARLGQIVRQLVNRY